MYVYNLYIPVEEKWGEDHAASQPVNAKGGGVRKERDREEPTTQQ